MISIKKWQLKYIEVAIFSLIGLRLYRQIKYIA